ncbi:pyridoxamine 5'-phosphate oxidase family protein [Kineococcus sp. R8]|uniref:pyridoxamine 5'-phosphate oxidase family protein n=1 Tax=Kineococcus siccus TaxID=2696567 RepID=UPI0014127E55|nr:pyridoxamine 5'-phosphate oxidase family protein [Kineococcus siccus]
MRWADLETAEPDVAAAVLGRFRAARHHVLATLTLDGSPRVSGTEVDVWRGDLVVGSMVGARKAADLGRDPRFALHAHTGDGSMADGDAKLAGTAQEVLDAEELADYVADRHPPEPFQLFRLLVATAVLTDLQGDGIRVRTLRPGRPLTTVVRGSAAPE